MNRDELKVGTFIKLREGRNIYEVLVYDHVTRCFYIECATFLEEENLGDHIMCQGAGQRIWVADFHLWDYTRA